MQDILEILPDNFSKQKVNYDKLLQKLIQSWQSQSVRPSLLIHTCCAPCSTYTLEYLTKYADVSIYFANSNIHPKEEYLRRKNEQEIFIKKFNKQNNQNVKFIAAPYQPEAFHQLVRDNDLANEKEGGLRCQACFRYRLDIVAKKALELGFDYFGSALTISPHKNSQVINEIGIEVAKLYATKYLPSDFKKNNGYLRSIELCEEYDVYRQCYCGCIYGAKDQEIDLKQVLDEAKEYLKQHEIKV